MTDISDIAKSDTINLEADLNTNMTGWKVRCEIYDDSGNCIRLATANTGGADTQIEITDAPNGIFLIKVLKTLTKCFDNKSFIEIEVETNIDEVHTVHQGEIQFKKERIDWVTPTD